MEWDGTFESWVLMDLARSLGVIPQKELRQFSWDPKLVVVRVRVALESSLSSRWP